ncbi:uncharacterized protein LOC144389450 [Gasterosteus aculeatus]
MEATTLDGRLLARVTMRTEPVKMQLSGNHSEDISFFILSSPHMPLVLGHPWLRKHNPTLDWVTGKVVSSPPPGFDPNPFDRRYSSGHTPRGLLAIRAWPVPWRCCADASGGQPWERTLRGLSLPVQSVHGIREQIDPVQDYFTLYQFPGGPGPTWLWIL